MSKYNSKGQLIEELDCPPIYMRGPFQSPKPTSPKRKQISEDPATPSPKPFESEEQRNLYAELYERPSPYLAEPYLAPPFSKVEAEPYLAPPFLNAQEAEILAWCEAYQNLKKQGLNLYKI